MVALVMLAGCLPATTAHAQTARDLNCRGCVGARDIGRKAVTRKHIRPNAITSAAITDGSVSADDLADGAKPAGIASGFVSGPIYLTGTPEIVFHIDVDAPGAGTIAASADFSAATSGAVWSCSLVSGNDAGVNTNFGGGTSGYFSASLTRVIPVAGAGPVTINLFCTEAGGNVQIENINVTALFVPASY